MKTINKKSMQKASGDGLNNPVKPPRQGFGLLLGDDEIIAPTMGQLIQDKQTQRKYNKNKLSQQRSKVDAPSTSSQAAHVQSNQGKTEIQAMEAKKISKSNRRHRPIEISSKIPLKKQMKLLKKPIQNSSSKRRDPRFDSLGGEFDFKKFRKEYDFIYDKQLLEDRDRLKKELKKTKNSDVKLKAKQELDQVQLMIRDDSVRKRVKQMEKEWNTNEKDAVSQGKQPYYLNKAAKKDMALRAQFEVLKESGKLEKYMERKRKKIAAKERKLINSTKE